MKLSADFIRQLPKVLLHEHLDGGLRPQTVIDLAASCRYQGLPTSDPVELGQWFHRGANKGNLHEYLEGFAHTIGFRVGKRDGYHADTFVGDLASRLNARAQLSSDGLAAYLDAVERDSVRRWTTAKW